MQACVEIRGYFLKPERDREQKIGKHWSSARQCSTEDSCAQDNETYKVINQLLPNSAPAGRLL